MLPLPPRATRTDTLFPDTTLCRSLELTIPELVRVGTSSEADPKLRNEANANFHFRMVEVAMMLLLPMAALAFAIPPKRSTSALGVFLSIVFIVTYHKSNEYRTEERRVGKKCVSTCRKHC